MVKVIHNCEDNSFSQDSYDRELTVKHCGDARREYLLEKQRTLPSSIARLL